MNMQEAMEKLRLNDYWVHIENTIKQKIQQLKEDAWEEQDATINDKRFSYKDLMKWRGKIYQEFLDMPIDLENKEGLLNTIDIMKNKPIELTEDEFYEDIKKYGMYI